MKSFNEYAAEFGPLYDRTPKAVFAAVALSYAQNFAGDKEAATFADAVARFVQEWQILHENGIVPQKPPRGIVKREVA